jgi:Ca2+-binding RTX toxin-like protein
MPTTIEGTDNADILVGGAASEVLLGLGGDDQLFGGPGGDDVFDGGAGADLIDGGIGFDTLVFRSATAGVALSLVTGGTGGDAAGDVYVSIENINGTAFNDFLEGNDLPNTILGGGGDNVIRSLGGDDWLGGGARSDTFYPGESNDRVFGGAGIDYVRYDDSPVGVAQRHPRRRRGQRSGVFRRRAGRLPDQLRYCDSYLHCNRPAGRLARGHRSGAQRTVGERVEVEHVVSDA